MTTATHEFVEAPVAPEQREAVQKIVAGARAATLAELLAKPVRRTKITLSLGDVEVFLRFQAISSTEYDALVASHPPTKKQRESGNAYNVDGFAPALIAACSLEPKMSLEEATALYTAKSWSGGEITDLFLTCARLCQSGLDVPFTEAG